MLDEDQLLEFFSLLKPVQTRVLEFKLYYDAGGKVITYTTDDLPGDYIVITQEQYTEARPDVLVKNNKIVYTHLQRYVFKLEKNTEGVATSKYDINIISMEPDSQYWKQQSYDISRRSN